ncbi:MAG: DUF4089 domain-containing protein [Caldimonas sp.]
MQREQLEACVDAIAAAMDLPLLPEHRPGVLMYFGLAASLADLIMAQPLGPGDEPAETFVPIGPEDLSGAGTDQ